MTTNDSPAPTDTAGLGGTLKSPTLVVLAAEAIRKKILAGELDPGDRLLEERLTEELGISRPPLREALQVLESEGLVFTLPRRGRFVSTLTGQDVYEILTLRSALERLAFDVGIPVRDPALLEPARAALEQMRQCVRNQDRGALVQAGYAFHSSLMRIAQHRRLEECYTSVQQQLLVCMSRNLLARERFYEDLDEHIERHQRLFNLVESGDKQAALAELAVHGERSFQEKPPNAGAPPASTKTSQTTGD